MAVDCRGRIRARSRGHRGVDAAAVSGKPLRPRRRTTSDRRSRPSRPPLVIAPPTTSSPRRSQMILTMATRAQLIWDRIVVARPRRHIQGQRRSMRAPIGHDLNVRYLVEGEVRSRGQADDGQRAAHRQPAMPHRCGVTIWRSTLHRQCKTRVASSHYCTVRVRRRVIARTRTRRASAPLPARASAMDLALHAHAVYLQDPCLTGCRLCEWRCSKPAKVFDRALQLDPNLVFGNERLAPIPLWTSWTLDLHADHDRLVQRAR